MDNKIDTSEISRRFEEHLNLEDNSRIIFSGLFGIGKTTFLDKFFTAKSKEYYTIKIYPVHYSIASNEDIFELIKYDILFHLFEYGLVVENKGEFKQLEYLPFFLTSKGIEYLTSFVKKVSKTGKTVIEIIEKTEKLKDAYENSYQEINKDAEYEKMIEYLKDKKELLYLYEDNFITQKIRETILLIKNEERETILIIDDLDRIDPEHIFRIFNIFSAHMSWKGKDENKFGFDKVILVCDFENIRSIYSHRYGINSDFNGYIDKFFSKSVFSFGNKDAIKLWMRQFFNSNGIVQTNKEEDRFLIDILEVFISEGELSIRNLQKIISIKFELDQNKMNRYRTVSLFIVYLILRLICTSHAELMKKLVCVGDLAATSGVVQFELFSNRIKYLKLFFLPVLKEHYNGAASGQFNYDIAGIVDLHYSLDSQDDRTVADVHSPEFTFPNKIYYQIMVDSLNKMETLYGM